ncbi:MAG TPA: DUF1080 domain-containing protein [Candidatus Eisenbacteria bacterium]|nr:DUF1080 domain-containing protein [Candidatus Eisenbacteria bacterium]
MGGCAQLAGPDDSGWVTLLDGSKGLENWARVGSANWDIVAGVLQADKKSGKENAFLVSKDSYDDFVLRVEFWASDDANSGVFIRCQDATKITDKSCYEVNIYDRRPDPSYGTGAIVNFAKVSPMPKAGGRWNTYEITAKGTQLVVVLNGRKTVELDDRSFAAGPVALQYGSGVVKFRKVQIKPL